MISAMWLQFVSQTVKRSVQVKQPGTRVLCPRAFGDDVVVPSSDTSRQVFHGAQCRTLFRFLTILSFGLYFGTKLIYV